MSAIIAIYDRQGNPAVTEQGTAMMQALSRFPADDEQTWQDRPGVVLGCRAQWITPESVGERNPLHDPERGLAVVADAILDNREELCDALGIEPARRANVTDPELLLLAYDAWGMEMAERLVGDFAFAIWDDRRRRLYAARDFSGTRTLYFTRDPASGTLWICTIMKPLLGLRHVSGSLNRRWIADYLAMPYTTDAVDARITVYEGIEQLPPAHYLAADAEGRLTLRAYCTIEVPRERLKLKSDAEYEEAFRDVLGRAVKARLRTYRAVGVQLSGGLDSGTVAAFAARELRDRGKPLHTFSYVPVPDFEDNWMPRSRIADERAYIHAVVEHVGNIVPNYCDFPDASPYSVIDEWLDVMEMPYKFYANAFWTRGIPELAAERDIAVILTGERGNWTVSWGPALDYQAELLKRLKFVRFYRELSGYARRIGAGRRRVMRVVWRKAVGGDAGADSEPCLASPNLLAETGAAERIRQYEIFGGNVYQARSQVFKQTTIWNLTGTCGTKLSLRHALWYRDPTNDLRVVRYCLSVPEEQCVRDGVDRALIRRATRGLLPDKVRLNQKVRGLQGADAIHRMRSAWPMFIREAEEMLKDEQMRSYLNLDALQTPLHNIRDEPKPEYVYRYEFRSLMQALIFRRFVIKHERR